MSKINERIEYYSNTLKTKQRLVESYHIKRNKRENLSNNEYMQMLVLEAEIQQIEEFIEDLKYIQKETKITIKIPQINQKSLNEIAEKMEKELDNYKNESNLEDIKKDIDKSTEAKLNQELIKGISEKVIRRLNTEE